MKKNQHWSVILLIVATVITSCGKDEKQFTEPDPQGDSKLKITLQLPPLGTKTRADIEGTTPENNIEGIYIYIFDQAGNLPQDPTKGKFGPLDLNDAAQFTQSGNTYTMVNEITTTAGTKDIYVIANADENEITPFGTRAQLLNSIENVHKTSAGSGGLIKFDTQTPPEPETIVFVGNTQQTLNSVASGIPNPDANVEIERALSRVITTSPANFTETWTGTTNATLAVSKYLVTQDAYRSYVGQNYFPAPNTARKRSLISGAATNTWGNTIRLYDPDDYIGTGATNIDNIYVGIVADPGNDPGRVALAGFYIGENITNTPNNVAQHGNTTYAWIQTQLATNNTAEASGTSVAYTGPALTAGTTFHLIRVNGVRDYISTAANAPAVIAALELQYPGDVYNFPYPDGYIYYRVFLNRTGTATDPIGPDDKYNVYRNQFIHIDIQGVNLSGDDPGGFGGGYPGDPDDPRVPIDPFSPDDDPVKPNPNPHDDEEPIDEEEATLRVNIVVKDWTYVPNNTILE